MAPYLVAFLLALALVSPISAADTDATVRRALALIKSAQPAKATGVLETLVADPSRRDVHPDALVLLGFLALGRADLAAAQPAFERALRERPEFPPARLGLGLVSAGRGETARAVEHFERVRDDPEVGRRARAQWIQALFIQGDDGRALAEARRAVAGYPAVAEYRALLGLLLQARGASADATTEYRRAVELEPTRLPTYFSLIGQYAQRRDWSSVVEWADRALLLDADHPLLYRAKAHALDELGRREDAREAREEAERTYEAERLYTAAAIARKAGRSGEIEALLTRCLTANPRLSKAWLELGEILRRNCRLTEAREAFVMALEADPDNTLAHLGLAELSRDEGKPVEAEVAYRRAIGRGLDDPDLFSGLAAAYLDQGKIEAAAAEMLRAVNALPDHPDLLAYLGHIRDSAARAAAPPSPAGPAVRERTFAGPGAAGARMQLEAPRKPAGITKSALDELAYRFSQTGEQARAIEHFERSLRVFGPDAVVHSNLAYLYRCRGRLELALRHYGRARDLSPRDPERQHDLGFALYLAREYRRAVEPLEAALALRPRWGLAHFDAAQVYWHLGEHARALQHARAAQELGVRGAEPVVHALSRHLNLRTPRLVSVYRPRSSR